MDKVAKGSLVTQLEDMGNKLLNIVYKLIYVVWILLFVYVNRPLIKIIMDEQGSASFYVYIGLLSAALIGSFVLVVKLRKLFEADKLSMIWFLLAIVHKSTEFNAYRWEGISICLVVPIAFYIILKYKKLFWMIPVMVVIADAFVLDFITTYLPLFIAIYVYKYRQEIDLKSRKTIVFTIVSVIIYVLGIIRGFICTDEFIAALMAFQFYNDYAHFGFCTRGLLATIIYAVLGYYRDWFSVKTVLLVMHILCVLGIILFSYLIYKEIPKKYKNDCSVVFLAVLVSGAIRYSSSITSVMYMDCMFLFLTVVCIYLLVKSRFLFLIPVLCGVAVCFHHISAILCFPFLFVCMCYRCICDKRKRDIVLLILTTITVGALFFYFHFIAYRFIPITVEQGMDYFREIMGADYNSGLEVNLRYVVYNGKVDSYGIQYSEFDLGNYLVLSASVIYNLFLLLPEILIVKSFFKKAGKKIWGILCLAQFIVYASYLEIDFFRWDTTIAMFLAIELMAMVTINQDSNWLTNLSDKWKNRFLDYVFIVILFIMPNI